MTLSGVASNVSDGLKVNAKVHDLGQRRYVQVTVATNTNRAVEDWAFEIKLPSAVLGICGGNYDRLSGVSYRITPDPWTRRIPPHGVVQLGLVLA